VLAAGRGGVSTTGSGVGAVGKLSAGVGSASGITTGVVRIGTGVSITTGSGIGIGTGVGGVCVGMTWLGGGTEGFTGELPSMAEATVAGGIFTGSGFGGCALIGFGCSAGRATPSVFKSESAAHGLSAMTGQVPAAVVETVE